MNKDVIYIEPEDDITDILANIKGAKHKIIALVPPKKSGVLRSIVNFKLIAKTAKQSEKTVVLITADESLLKLADSVKMPTAKTLQSKPKLPTDLEAEEFGGDEEDDLIDDEESEEVEKDDVIEEKAEPKEEKKVAVKEPVKKTATAAVAAKAAKKPTEIELDDEDDDDDNKDKKAKKNLNIPDFKKYRKVIIFGVIIIAAIFGFSFWASVIAPKAKITVKLRTSSQNFSEQVTFTKDAKKADPENGIFLLEEKSIKKSVSADFEATGELNKGEKAKGTVTVVRPAGSQINGEADLTFSIPKGTSFTINGKTYVSTEGASANATVSDLDGIFTHVLKHDISSGSIPVVAKEAGEKYNMDAASSGWASSLVTPKKYTISSTAMTGGTDKIVKVVTDKDVEEAGEGLDVSGESEALGELSTQVSYSFEFTEEKPRSSGGKVTASPAVDQEVSEDVTPKVIKEVTYKIYAVDRDSIEKYITKKAKENIGDATQSLYSTGVFMNEEGKEFIRFEKFDESSMTATLKSTGVKTGPEISEQIIADKTLGRKVGEVQTLIKSIKGIADVDVETSYFFVTSIPNDINKVQIEIIEE